MTKARLAGVLRELYVAEVMQYQSSGLIAGAGHRVTHTTPRNMRTGPSWRTTIDGIEFEVLVRIPRKTPPQS